MFTILNATVDPEIGRVKFSCNLSGCHGACCTMPGGRGAPLAPAEVLDVEQATPAALEYLPERNRDYIERRGATEGRRGDYATRCIDRRDCVFVYYEGTVAKCAIERAYFAGKTPFRKPVSCHLFPIRVGEYFGGPYLYYEEISECRPALEQGRRQDVPLVEFLEEAITRAFGTEFYRTLLEAFRSNP